MVTRLDIRLSPAIALSLNKVRERCEAPSMNEMVGAIIEDWLKQRGLLLQEEP